MCLMMLTRLIIWVLVELLLLVCADIDVVSQPSDDFGNVSLHHNPFAAPNKIDVDFLLDTLCEDGLGELSASPSNELDGS